MPADATTLGSIWTANAGWYKDEIALVYGDGRKTYREFLGRARRLACALYARGLRKQERIAVLAMNSDVYPEIYAAGELSGLVVATVNFRLAPAEVVFILNDAAPTVLFFEPQYAAMVDDLRSQLRGIAQFVCIGPKTVPWAVDYESLIASAQGDEALPTPTPSDIAYIIYTSGTTGRPKGCMLDHASQVNTGRYIAELLQMSAASRTLLVMPFYHIGAKGLQLAQHRTGGQVHIHRSFDVVNLLETVQRERISHLHLAPVMLQAMIEHPAIARYDLSSIRNVCYSAAPMPEPILRKGLALLGSVFTQFWGQTEGIGLVLPAISHRPDDATSRRRLTSVGHPFPGMEVRIVDESDRDVPAGVAGEMLIKGSVMMAGYWNQSASSLDALRGGWLHTGDVCLQDEDGFIFLVDRKKDMIISGGENIYSREVEEAVNKHEAVLECAVIGLPHPRWGEAVCAVVVVRPGVAATAADIVHQCRSLIASYKRPRYVIFENDLPRLPSGKVSKVELRRRYREMDGIVEV